MEARGPRVKCQPWPARMLPDEFQGSFCHEPDFIHIGS